MSKQLITEYESESTNHNVDAELKVEREDVSSSSDVHPWNPDKIRIYTKHFSLREVTDQITNSEIELSPDFQRDYVWNDGQRVKLIESILLGIPLPSFYFNQSKDGVYQIVDGVQRLSTINAFMKNEYALNSQYLEYLKELNGCYFSNLSPLDSRRFRSTQIVANVIEPSTPEAIKYDIFSRVNTLGSPLKPQEIRHAISTVRSRDFLKSLVESVEFDIATENNFWRSLDGKQIRDSGRMTNRELVLRFCAFKLCDLESYKQHASLDRFLIDFTRRLDGKKSEENMLPPISDEQMEYLKSSFISAMKSAHYILGECAFRRIETNKRKGPINRAIFESQSIALSDYPYEQLITKANEIKSEFLRLFQNVSYTKSVTVGTGAPNSVSIRLEEPRKILKEIFND